MRTYGGNTVRIGISNNRLQLTHVSKNSDLIVHIRVAFRTNYTLLKSDLRTFPMVMVTRSTKKKKRKYEIYFVASELR